MQAKPEVLLENWQDHGGYFSGNAYRHPCTCSGAEMGCEHAYWCPGQHEGVFVTTSAVLDTDGATFAETLNTLYALGRRAGETAH